MSSSSKCRPQLGALAAKHLDHLRNADPELVLQLQNSNNLTRHCNHQARFAAEESDHLVQQGMSRGQADLIAAKHFIYPLSERAIKDGVSEDL